MKKLIIPALLVAAAIGVTGCNDKKADGTENQATNSEQASPELTAAISQRDSLLTLVSDIWAEMDHIKQLEQILTVNAGSYEGNPDKRRQIQADIAAIQKTLQERRDKLAELEEKLDSSNASNKALTGTIAALRKEIDTQTNVITSLRSQLGIANTRIDSLDAHVDSLTVNLTDVTTAKEEVEKLNTELTNEMNECYYAIGSNSELKKSKILESGFLRKTKILKGDFDMNAFTTGDKRTLNTIDLYSKKAEVMTNQPKDSYVIEEANGHKVLRITNPEKFWSLSNFLVIKID